MDIAIINGDEYLFYADKTAHCVNSINLSNNQIRTEAGICGTSGGDAAGIDVSDSNTSIGVHNGGLLTSPIDVAYGPDNETLYMTSRYKVKAVPAFLGPNQSIVGILLARVLLLLLLMPMVALR